jgi:hypothetical protein
MKERLNLQETNIVTAAGQTVNLAYEEVGDILEIIFQGVQATTAIELTDNILLSFDRELEEAAGLTILSFSVLAAGTELGPRSFALTGLDDLPESLREIVIRIITQSPVNEFLKVVSFYTPSAQVIPLTYLESARVLLPAV